jgi:hypothetical protein
VIGLHDRYTRDRASQRQVDIENLCSLGDKPELVPLFMASDKNLGDLLRQLVQFQTLDRFEIKGTAAAYPN